MSRGLRKAAKRDKRLRALAKCAPAAVAFARWESSRGWDGRLASVPHPEEAWARAVSCVLAMLLVGPERCSCGHSDTSAELHACQYEEEIRHNDEPFCRCCDGCAYQCGRDI